MTSDEAATRLAGLINDVIAECMEQDEDSDGNYHDYVSVNAGERVMAALREAGVLREGL